MYFYLYDLFILIDILVDIILSVVVHVAMDF